ncbi:MAG: peptidoglycan-binding protein [Caulobacterales bacterium]
MARQSGLSLNEWLVRMMADEGPEDATSQESLAERHSIYSDAARPSALARIDAAKTSATANVEGAWWAAQALERLTDRIETAESRQFQAIAGVEQSVRGVIERIDAAEREQIAGSVRIEGSVQSVRVDLETSDNALRNEVHELRGDAAAIAERVGRMEAEAHGPRSAEAMHALEGALGKVAGHLFDGERRTREMIGDVKARVLRLEAANAGTIGAPAAVVDMIGSRLDEAEKRSASVMRELQTSLAALDSRIGGIEARSAEADGQQLEQHLEQRLEQVGAALSSRVDAARQEMAERIRATAEVRFDRVEQALAEMTDHVRTAEQRSASAIERMGREVLDVAQTLNRRVQTVENRSAEAAEQVGVEVSRIANAVEGRFARADSIQAQALEKLGGEIARITERLAERIASAERRSAQAIDDVGEQVSRVTERLGQRNERVVDELSERIRLSEERTARLLEEARQKIDDRLGGTQRRAAEVLVAPPPAAPAPTAADDDSLFADTFPGVEEPKEPEQPFGVRPPVSAALASFPVEDRQVAPVQAGFDDHDEEFDSFPAVSPEAEEKPFAAFAPAAHDDAFAPAPHEAEADADAQVFGEHEAEAEPATHDAEAAEPATHDAEEAEPVTFGAEAAEPATYDAELHEDGLAAHAGAFEAKSFELEPNEGFGPVDEFVSGTRDEDTPSLEPEVGQEPVEEAPPAPLTTREVIERARAAARAASEKAAKGGERPKDDAQAASGGLFSKFGFGRPKRAAGGGTALMIALTVTAVGAAGVGLVALEASNGSPGLPKEIADALSPAGGQSGPAQAGIAAAQQHAAPMAALAISPQPITAGPDLGSLYAAAVARYNANPKTGLDDIRRLANQGYAQAQFFIGERYAKGEGVAKDAIQARLWTQRAAEGGDRKAMHNLGMDYFDGTGGPRNPTVGVEWFRRAAELGLVDSQYNLGKLYEAGVGVSPNAAEAYKWYLIASKAGDQESGIAAARVSTTLTPQAKAEAEHAAAAFRPSTAAAPTAPSAPAGATASADLVTAQKALSQLGYFQGPADGAPSPALRLAIAAFQHDQNMTQTGSLDPTTLTKLSVYAN